MLSAIAPGEKRNADHATATLRVPTPKNPPKSMTAARTSPGMSDKDIGYRPEFLSCCAGYNLSEQTFDLIIVDDDGRRSFGRGFAVAGFFRCSGSVVCGRDGLITFGSSDAGHRHSGDQQTE